MKFFRQTKETKRKISFFMALAMVISLLPVSPVAKAEEKEATVTVTGSVIGASITSVTSSSAVSGEAIITLTANDNYTFDDASKKTITVSTNGAIESKAANPCTVAAVTDSAMADNKGVTYTVTPKTTTCEITIKNISKDITVTLGGTATLKEEPDPDNNKGKYKVTYTLPQNSNIRYTVTSGGAAFNSGTDVVSGTVIKFEATPEDGYVWAEANALPSISVTPSQSVNFTKASGKNTATAEVTINAETTITVSDGKVVQESSTPGDETYSVVIDKSKLTSGISLTTTKKDGTAFNTSDKIKKGESINLTVKPNDTDAIWNETPDLTVVPEASKNTAWSVGSDKAYNSTVTINADTTITVSGGSLVAVTNDIINDVADKTTVADNENNMTVDKDAMKDTAVVNNIIQAIVKEYNTTSDGTITVADILDAMSNNTAKVNTSFSIKPSEDSFSSETAAKELLAKLPEDVKFDVKSIQDGVALDISITSDYLVSDEVVVSVAITELGKKIKITMDIPEALNKVDKANGKFYAIRIHGDEVTALECTENDGKISFLSDKFSTYVISFVENKKDDPKPDDPKPNTPSGGGGAYIPSTSATPAPSASAAPSASPSASADPSATPGADNTAAPAESSAPSDGGDNTTPTNSPAATDKPNDTGKDDTTDGTGPTAVKVGKKATVSGSQYKVTAVKGTRTVQFTKGKKNAKSIVVPSTVKISGKNYKVTTIAKNAFKGNKKLTKVTIGKNVNKIGVSAFQNCSKLKSIVIKSTKLTAKKVGKNAFKGINKKATFKVPKSKVKAYKKIVKAKGAGKNVKVKK